MIVIDASVAAKWFLPEHGSEEAARLLEPAGVILAPRLIRLEVAAAITRKLRLGELAEPKVRRASAEWFAALAQDAVKLVADEDLLDEAIELSLKVRHGLQDCMYLAAAARSRLPLITADHQFVERARAAYPNVKLLKGCRPN